MGKKAESVLKPLFAPSRSFGNSLQLSKITGEKSDDLVGFTVVCGSNDDGICLEERHKETKSNPNIGPSVPPKPIRNRFPNTRKVQM